MMKKLPTHCGDDTCSSCVIAGDCIFLAHHGESKILQKEMIWQAGDELFYPKGVTDPDYCVLKFTAHKGRYYSSFKSEDFEIQT